jgi:hypothetical protein
MEDVIAEKSPLTTSKTNVNVVITLEVIVIFGAFILDSFIGELLGMIDQVYVVGKKIFSGAYGSA